MFLLSCFWFLNHSAYIWFFIILLHFHRSMSIDQSFILNLILFFFKLKKFRCFMLKVSLEKMNVSMRLIYWLKSSNFTARCEHLIMKTIKLQLSSTALFLSRLSHWFSGFPFFYAWYLLLLLGRTLSILVICFDDFAFRPFTWVKEIATQLLFSRD